MGWDRAEIDSMWREMHREDYYYRRLVGPSTLQRHSYMYAWQACHDFPLRAIGAWEPAKLVGTVYDEQKQLLSIALENNGSLALNTRLLIIVEKNPADSRNVVTSQTGCGHGTP